MKSLKAIFTALLVCSISFSSLAIGGGEGGEESEFNFKQLRSEVAILVKPLMLKAKAQNKMWVVFTIDENRQLQLLDHSAELIPLSEELKSAINNKLLTAGSFYSDTPYTLWVTVKEI